MSLVPAVMQQLAMVTHAGKHDSISSNSYEYVSHSGFSTDFAGPTAGRTLLPFLNQQVRSFASAHPEIAVYAGPQPPQKAVTLRTLRSKYDKKIPISMATAYDYPSAVHVSVHSSIPTSMLRHHNSGSII